MSNEIQQDHGSRGRMSIKVKMRRLFIYLMAMLFVTGCRFDEPGPDAVRDVIEQEDSREEDAEEEVLDENDDAGDDDRAEEGDLGRDDSDDDVHEPTTDHHEGSFPDVMCGDQPEDVDDDVDDSLHEETCDESLDSRILELQNLIDTLEHDGYTDEFVDALLKFRDDFHFSAKKFNAPGAWGSIVLSNGVSQAAALLASGSWNALAPQAFAIGMTVVFLKECYHTLFDTTWGHYDVNTAFYTWLLDYLEKGKSTVSGYDDKDDLKLFLRRNARKLERITGFVPPNTETGIELYLSKYALELFAFFGRLREIQDEEGNAGSYFPIYSGGGYAERFRRNFRPLLAKKQKLKLIELKDELEELNCQFNLNGRWKVTLMCDGAPYQEVVEITHDFLTGDFNGISTVGSSCMNSGQVHLEKTDFEQTIPRRPGAGFLGYVHRRPHRDWDLDRDLQHFSIINMNKFRSSRTGPGGEHIVYTRITTTTEESVAPQTQPVSPR